MIYLNLIRYKNLLIIATSMYLMRYAIILPQLLNSNIHTSISDLIFFLSTIAVVLIAAGGNIINDYYDIKADLINKPSKIILDKYISIKNGILLYWGLTLAGLLIAIFSCIWIKYIPFIIPFFLSAILLLLYSSTYKRKSFIGNIIISFLSALTIYLPWMLEQGTLIFIYTDNLKTSNFINQIILIYAFFAFTTTMIREIIKDIEDMDGDIIAGYNTLPIKYGINKAKLLSLVLCMFTALPIMAISFRLLTFNLMFAFWYVLILILIPISYIAYQITTSNSYSEASRISLFMKLLMVMGLASALFFY